MVLCGIGTIYSGLITEELQGECGCFYTLEALFVLVLTTSPYYFCVYTVTPDAWKLPFLVSRKDMDPIEGL